MRDCTFVIAQYEICIKSVDIADLFFNTLLVAFYQLVNTLPLYCLGVVITRLIRFG
jgi:hypothetical protein